MRRGWIPVHTRSCIGKIGFHFSFSFFVSAASCCSETEGHISFENLISPIHAPIFYGRPPRETTRLFVQTCTAIEFFPLVRNACELGLSFSTVTLSVPQWGCDHEISGTRPSHFSIRRQNVFRSAFLSAAVEFCDYNAVSSNSPFVPSKRKVDEATGCPRCPL